TFSKVLFPALRLAYLVVPRDLIHGFLVARYFASRHPPRLEQAVLAAFIAEGHFDRHVRRMRSLYALPQEALVEAAGAELAGVLRVAPSSAGMHLVGWMPDGADDARAATRARAANVEASPLSAFAIERRPAPGLVLGYAGVSEPAIRAAAGHL